MEKCTCGCNVDGGCYCCCNCGLQIDVNKGDTLPPCPRCSNQTFVKETAENQETYAEKRAEYEEKD